MDSQRKISGAVIRRLPGYYRYLKRLEMEGVQRRLARPEDVLALLGG